MRYMQDWYKTKQRLEALWENEVLDRCCVAITAVKEGGYYTRNDASSLSKEDRVKYYTDAEWILERNIQRLDNMLFEGDALPCIFPFFGTAGHAAYFKSTA